MSEFGASYHVNTSWTEDLIRQEIVQDLRGVRETMWAGVMKLREQGIREALIALGWTPPPSEPR